MRPIVITTSVMLNADPETVWPWLVDWEKLGLWMKEASDFRVLSPHREGVGVSARATIQIAGIKTSDVITITQWDPPAKLTMAHEGWVKGTGTMTLAPHQDGTRLTWVESLIPPLGLLGWLGMILVKPAMRRVFTHDAGLLAALVARSPAD